MSAELLSIILILGLTLGVFADFWIGGLMYVYIAIYSSDLAAALAYFVIAFVFAFLNGARRGAK